MENETSHQTELFYRPLTGDRKRYVNASLVPEMVLYSYASLLRLEVKGCFPKRIQLGKGRFVWDVDDVHGWMQSKIDLRASGYITHQTIIDHDRFIDYHQLYKIVPYSRAHIHRLEAAQEFPGRITLGEQRAAWLEREVVEWVRGKAQVM